MTYDPNDIELCSKCGGEMELLSDINDNMLLCCDKCGVFSFKVIEKEVDPNEE